MTTLAGHHHSRAAPIFDVGTFALAAAGLLLTASLLAGAPSLGSTVTDSATRASAQPVATRHPVATTRAVASSTTATAAVAAVPVVPAPGPAVSAPADAAATAVTATTPPPPPAPAFTTGCGDALAYLASHQAPGFVDTCASGSALGHYGYTCATVPGRCDGVRIIHIACPAPFVFMNEAHNSWTLIGQGSGIDPYGQGNAAERAACDRYR